MALWNEDSIVVDSDSEVINTVNSTATNVTCVIRTPNAARSGKSCADAAIKEQTIAKGRGKMAGIQKPQAPALDKVEQFKASIRAKGDFNQGH